MSLKSVVRQAAQRIGGWYPARPAPPQLAEGDCSWAFDLIAEPGRTRLFTTFQAMYGPRKDALIVDLLTRWLRFPAAAGLTLSTIQPDPAMDMGRVAPLLTQGYARTWALIQTRAQRDYEGDAERAVQESVKEVSTTLGY